MIVRKSLHSLTGKLLITIGTLMVAGSALFWYFLFSYQEKELLKNSIKYGYSFADSIKKSTYYGMMNNQRLLIQQTVEALGSAEGVMKIRIFNCTGKISHSSQKTENNTVMERDVSVCSVCHVKNDSPSDKPMIFITRDKNDFRILNIIQPIYNEMSCWTASCHVHPENKKVLGIIEANLSLAPLDKNIQKQGIAITIYVLGFLFVISPVLCAILWNFVSVPVSHLAQGMERVAGGDLDYRVEIKSKDEMGELASAFNAMASDLKKAKSELMEWGNTLEKKVQEKTEAIHRAQAQLIHSEKLASLGRMAAGVAHEINSPLTGIVTFGHLLLKKFPEGSEEYEDIQVIIEQANRCSNIIKGLLGFARASAAEKTPSNINDVITHSLNIVKNKADFFNIKLVTELAPDLYKVKSDSSQLQQVFMNMVVNAADACEGKGTITIRTKNILKDDKDFIEIEFKDTGSGITQEDLAKIFEPFFTTKPVGKGTGLGLAVSHGIIQEHGGTITVKSAPGEGTSFFIRLPAFRETT